MATTAYISASTDAGAALAPHIGCTKRIDSFKVSFYVGEMKKVYTHVFSLIEELKKIN